MARSLYFTDRREYYRLKREAALEDYYKQQYAEEELEEPKDWPSECVAAIEYDHEAEDLIIHFQKRGSYVYHSFPKWAFSEFNNAGSRGTYFNLYIRNAGYSYERVA